MRNTTNDPVRIPVSGKLITRSILALALVVAAIGIVIYYSLQPSTDYTAQHLAEQEERLMADDFR